MKEIKIHSKPYKHGQCLDSVVSMARSPHRNQSYSRKIQRVKYWKSNQKRQEVSLVGYLDWIDSEENSPRIGLKLIRHSFQG